jgi:hypothetical protein
MQSLWRMIAARWLGGQVSDRLTGDTALHDLLTLGAGDRPSAFLVRREAAVSHRAMMAHPHPLGAECGPALPDVVTASRED